MGAICVTFNYRENGQTTAWFSQSYFVDDSFPFTKLYHISVLLCAMTKV